MGFTPEEKREWIKKYNAGKKDRKKASADRRVKEYQLKQTHDWDSELIREGYLGLSGRLQATNCKRCGLSMQMFKINPVACKEED